MNYNDIAIIAIWLLCGWIVVFKIHWCNQVFSITVLEVSGPKWMAYLMEVCAVVFWPIGPIITAYLLRWAMKIKNIKVDD